jgi:FkbM family methyltransferase
MAFLKTLNVILNHPLCRDKRMNALWRYFKWQIGSRLIPGEVVYEWMDGIRFIVRKGETGLVESIYTGLLEFEEMAFFLHYIDDKDLFIDVGSNVGTYSLLCCGVKKARGYAFEPVAGTYRRLSQNLRLNHLEERIKALNVCVGDKPGTLLFTANENVTNHVLTKQGGCDSIRVEVKTLDAILRNEKSTSMKIDVEGYEVPVLKGAKRTLKKSSLSVVLIETNGSGARYGYDDSTIVSIMKGYGFSPCSYNPFERELQPLPGVNPKGSNTLFVREVNKVKDRVRNEKKIHIFGYAI